MIAVCQQQKCGMWIERPNTGWPGFCSARCRDADRAASHARRSRRRAAALRGDPTAREALYREDYL